MFARSGRHRHCANALAFCVCVCGAIAAEEEPKASAATTKPAPSGGLLQLLFGGGAAKTPTYDSATHEKMKVVKVAGKEVSGNLQTLCADRSGNVVAVVGRGRYDNRGAWGANSKPSSEIQVFDKDGKFKFSWTVGFMATAVCVSPKGDVFVAGDGQIVRCKPDGKIVVQSEAPHLAAILADGEKLKRLAEQRKEQTVNSYESMLKQFEKQAEQQRKATSNGNNKQANAVGDENDQMIKTYKQIADQARRKSVEEYQSEIGAQVRSVNSIAASDNEIFLTCGEAKGYGFSVWRMGYDLGNAKQIKEGLSGCCGQMDVQCRSDGLVIAENTRHRVGLYDFDGKSKGSFGSRDREGEGAGFGGCCNPMNTRPCPNGDIITAESEGFIKRFSADGKFLGLIAYAPLSGGCKNVAVAATDDLDRIYFCDQPGSQILILSRKAEKPAVADRGN